MCVYQKRRKCKSKRLRSTKSKNIFTKAQNHIREAKGESELREKRKWKQKQKFVKIQQLKKCVKMCGKYWKTGKADTTTTISMAVYNNNN